MLTPISPISSKILRLGLGPIKTYEFAAEGMQSRQTLPGHGSLEASSHGWRRDQEGSWISARSSGAPSQHPISPTPCQLQEIEQRRNLLALTISDQSLEASSHLSVSLWGMWPICSLEQVESRFLWALRPGMQPRAVEAMQHQTPPLWCPGGKDRTGKTSSCDSQGSSKATV